MKHLRFLALGICLSAPLTAQGHHSFAMFDANTTITLTGVVKEFRWTNPHTFVLLTVTNEDGTQTIWELEHGPTNMLSRQGWTSSTLKPGDRIAVKANPTHDNRPTARLLEFDFAEDGQAHPARPELSSISTIRNVPRPDPVEMSRNVARNFNGIWLNANGGIHFDTAVPRAAQTPPLRPQYMAAWKQRAADARAGKSTNDPTALCLPPGFPRFLGMVYPGEILQTENQLNWFAEWGEATVRVHLDGRSVPANLESSYNGYTTGTWSDNTLVTRTVGLRGDTLIDTTGVPHSDQLTVTMRMSKVTPDYFEVEVTLEDPVVFFEPWRTVKRYVRAPADYYIQEYSCFEGNRYRVGDDGGIEIVSEKDVQP